MWEFLFVCVLARIFVCVFVFVRRTDDIWTVTWFFRPFVGWKCRPPYTQQTTSASLCFQVKIGRVHRRKIIQCIALTYSKLRSFFLFWFYFEKSIHTGAVCASNTNGHILHANIHTCVTHVPSSRRKSTYTNKWYDDFGWLLITQADGVVQYGDLRWNCF